MFALLYDVHGNARALEAVIADAHDAGATRWLIGGDVALFGPEPRQCVDLLRGLGSAASWIRGNGERWTADPGAAPGTGPVPGAIAHVRAALGIDDVQQLTALPERCQVDEHTAAWHASPLSDLRTFMTTPADSDRELLAGEVAERIIVGHAHLPFLRTLAPRADDPRTHQIVAPGSVGLPFDGDQRAAYGLLGSDGFVTLRRVAYDHEAAAQALEQLAPGELWTAVGAKRLRTGRAD